MFALEHWYYTWGTRTDVLVVGKIKKYMYIYTYIYIKQAYLSYFWV